MGRAAARGRASGGRRDVRASGGRLDVRGERRARGADARRRGQPEARADVADEPKRAASACLRAAIALVLVGGPSYSPGVPPAFGVDGNLNADGRYYGELRALVAAYVDDVAADARFDASIHHEYLAPATPTDGCGGYMLMTAYLAFADVLELGALAARFALASAAR